MHFLLLTDCTFYRCYYLLKKIHEKTIASFLGSHSLIILENGKASFFNLNFLIILKKLLFMFDD